jgi:hypothetical protein
MVYNQRVSSRSGKILREERIREGGEDIGEVAGEVEVGKRNLIHSKSLVGRTYVVRSNYTTALFIAKSPTMDHGRMLLSHEYRVKLSLTQGLKCGCSLPGVLYIWRTSSILPGRVQHRMHPGAKVLSTLPRTAGMVVVQVQE